MAETEGRPTLSMTASFPIDARFAPTAGELASRVAVAAGIANSEASAIGQSVEAAYTKALDGSRVERGPAIEVSMCAGETSLDVSVSCGSARVLIVRHPRP